MTAVPSLEASHGYCEKTTLPFEATGSPWSELCLAVPRGSKVRTIRRESCPATWCVAQAEDGRVGLFPVALLARAPGERFALKRVATPVHVDSSVTGPDPFPPSRGSSPLSSPDTVLHCNVSASTIADGEDTDDEDILDFICRPKRHHQKSSLMSAAERPDAPSPSGKSNGGACYSPPPLPGICQGNAEATKLVRDLQEIRLECEWLAHVQCQVVDAVHRNRKTQIEIERAHAAEVEALTLRNALLTALATHLSNPDTVTSPFVDDAVREWAPFSPKPNDGELSDLVESERETLTSYLEQEATLKRREEKVAVLLTKLEEESNTLRVSEEALAALVSAEGNMAAISESMYPRMLDGLTKEESEALQTHIELYEKYVTKRANLLATGGPPETSLQAIEKLRKRITYGDTILQAKMTDLSELTNFVEKNAPIAKQIEEQLAIGRNVVQQKQQLLERYSDGRAT